MKTMLERFDVAELGAMEPLTSISHPFKIPPVRPVANERGSAGDILFFWFSVYFGTVTAGAVFGASVMAFFSLMEGEIQGMLFAGVGAFFGFLFAGCVGALVVPSVAIVSWALFLMHKAPRWSAAVAGGLTGVICGWVGFWPMSGPCGALGAACFGHVALNGTRRGAAFKSTLNETPVSFSLSSLFLRMTAIATLIALWQAVLGAM